MGVSARGGALAVWDRLLGINLTPRVVEPETVVLLYCEEQLAFFGPFWHSFRYVLYAMTTEGHKLRLGELRTADQGLFLVQELTATLLCAARTQAGEGGGPRGTAAMTRGGP